MTNCVTNTTVRYYIRAPDGTSFTGFAVGRNVEVADPSLVIQLGNPATVIGGVISPIMEYSTDGICPTPYPRAYFLFILL